MIKLFDFENKELDEQIRRICRNVKKETLTKTADFWIKQINDTILIDASSNSVDGVLPLAANFNGEKFYIKAMDISNAVTLTPQSGDTIEGAAGYTFTAANEAITLISDGISNWNIW